MDALSKKLKTLLEKEQITQEEYDKLVESLGGEVAEEEDKVEKEDGDTEKVEPKAEEPTEEEPKEEQEVEESSDKESEEPTEEEPYGKEEVVEEPKEEPQEQEEEPIEEVEEPKEEQEEENEDKLVELEKTLQGLVARVDELSECVKDLGDIEKPDEAETIGEDKKEAESGDTQEDYHSILNRKGMSSY